MEQKANIGLSQALRLGDLRELAHRHRLPPCHHLEPLSELRPEAVHGRQPQLGQHERQPSGLGVTGAHVPTTNRDGDDNDY